MIVDLMQKILPLPPLASVEGKHVDTLMYLIHGLIFFLFVGWAIYYVVVLIKFRRSKNPKVVYPKKESHIGTVLEWAVAILEFFLLFAFSIPFWSSFVANTPKQDNVVEIKVVAQQFAWLVHYPGPDGKFGKASVKFLDDNPIGLDPDDPHVKDDITTMNQIYLPLDRPVIIRMTSKDVIHSFGVPAMRVKQDIIPGIGTFVTFTPNKLGQYEIVCSQLCGLGHYQMRGIINVVTPAEYDQWVREEKGNIF